VPDRFHLAALKDDADLELVEDVIIVASLAVLDARGEGFVFVLLGHGVGWSAGWYCRRISRNEAVVCEG